VKARIFITGPPRSGKTTLVMEALSRLKKFPHAYAGFITPEVRAGGERVGFDVLLLPSSESIVLARKDRITGSSMKHGSYWLNPDAGKKISLFLRETIENPEVSLLVIDEIGPMELAFREFEGAVLEAISSSKSIIATFHVSLPSRNPKLFRAMEGEEIIDLRNIGYNEALSKVLKSLEKMVGIG